MKLQYVLNTEMWVIGAGYLKHGDVIEEKNQKRINKFLRTGMFKKVHIKRKKKKKSIIPDNIKPEVKKRINIKEEININNWVKENKKE